tara:strand:- start:2466 stop:6098 length:3633 start_codon:yes stop_codon:yes gene_type:complete
MNIKDIIGQRESNGDYSAVNSLGYAGKYQFGKMALIDTGYKDSDGNWTGKDGVTSKEQWLANHDAQEKAMDELMRRNTRALSHFGLDEFIGKTINGTKITMNGALASAHLLGAKGTVEMLRSGEAKRDAYGTSGFDYIAMIPDEDEPDPKPEPIPVRAEPTVASTAQISPMVEGMPEGIGRLASSDVAEDVSPDLAVGSEGIESTTYSPEASAPRPVAPSTSENRLRLFYADELDYTQENRLAIQSVQNRVESARRFREESVTGGDIFVAAMQNHNPVVSWIAQEPLPLVPDIEGYSPYDKNDAGESDIKGYEQYYESFIDSYNPETTAAIKRRIDRENRNQQILQQGGAAGTFASIAAGFTDPINIAMMAVPIAREARIASLVGTGLAATTTTETILQATQETRTWDESMTNIAAGVILDSVLGSTVKGIEFGQRELIKQEVAKHIGDLSAARTRVTREATGAEIVKSGPLSTLAATMAKITPLGRTLQSENMTVRAVVQEMVESGIRLEGDFMPTAVESLIKLDYAKYANKATQVRNIQRQFTEETGMDKDVFSIELTTAMRNGDVHQNAHIERAAGILREHIDDLWTRAANLEIEGTFVKQGDEVQPVRSETSESYLTRRYDLNMVRQDPEGFKQAWIAGLKDQRERTNLRLAEEGEDLLEDLTEAEWREVAADIYAKVTDLHVGDLHFNAAPSGATFLKSRVDVKDEFLDAYLVKDWESLMEGYTKSLAPRVRLAERFGAGDSNYMLKDQIQRIQDDFATQIGEIDTQISAATGKEKKKLQARKEKLIKQQVSDIRDVEIMRDRLLNTTQEPHWLNPENRAVLSGLRAARSWNIVTMLSNVLVSSIPDLARTITYHGGGKFAKAFTRSAFSKDIKRSTLPKSDMARMASAMERASSYRLQQISEVEDGIVHTSFDKYAHATADKVLTLSGMKHWNVLNKTVAGHLVGDRIGQILSSGRGFSKLKQLGLDDQAIADAAEYAKRFAIDDDGLINLNLDMWPDRVLVEKIEAAAIKEADRLVVTPTAGDKPILMSTEVGRTLFQFKSFMVSATNKMMLPLFQESGIRPWVEIMTQLGLGLAVANFKAAMNGREIEGVDDQLMAAIDHTGLAGYGMELMRAGRAVTGIDPFGEEQDAKFYARGPWGTLLGPSAGTAENAWRAVYSDSSAEARARAVRKLMPMQNHLILRRGYDIIEDEAAKAMGKSSPSF